MTLYIAIKFLYNKCMQAIIDQPLWCVEPEFPTIEPKPNQSRLEHQHHDHCENFRQQACFAPPQRPLLLSTFWKQPNQLKNLSQKNTASLNLPAFPLPLIILLLGGLMLESSCASPPEVAKEPEPGDTKGHLAADLRNVDKDGKMKGVFSIKPECMNATDDDSDNSVDFRQKNGDTPVDNACTSPQDISETTPGFQAPDFNLHLKKLDDKSTGQTQFTVTRGNRILLQDGVDETANFTLILQREAPLIPTANEPGHFTAHLEAVLKTALDEDCVIMGIDHEISTHYARQDADCQKNDPTCGYPLDPQTGSLRLGGEIPVDDLDLVGCGAYTPILSGYLHKRDKYFVSLEIFIPELKKETTTTP